MMQIGEQAIRDTVARVFSAPEYNASSPLAPVYHWLHDQFARLLAWIAGILPSRTTSPMLFWITVGVLAVAVAGAVGATVWRWWRRRLRRAAAGQAEGTPLPAAHADPWRAAQRLAAEGAFTDAAHALYQALLQGAAREGQLRLHPSKTAGDYARELRGRSSALLERFRAFASSYEAVVYGLRGCDRERYERLRTLAVEMLHPHA
jgi:hypothetical protein